MFTTATNLMLYLSIKIVTPEKPISIPAIAMLGGVSVEGSWEGWLTRPRSIDSAAFVGLLCNLL